MSRGIGSVTITFMTERPSPPAGTPESPKDTAPPPDGTTIAIDLRDLRKTYGDTVAVEAVSLTIRSGEVFGILGPNGSGKTTTVECMAGLRRADTGTVRVHGLDPATDEQEVRRRVGVQLQHAALPDRMRVGEAVAVFAAAHGRPSDGSSLLGDWGLEAKRRSAFASLSGGQRQRLFIALALLGDPDIVILDELTTGLDPAARRDTWALVRRLHDRGTTVVLVTHSMDEAEALCDRLAVLVDGRIVAGGAPGAVRGDHQTLEHAYLSITDRARRVA